MCVYWGIECCYRVVVVLARGGFLGVWGVVVGLGILFWLVVFWILGVCLYLVLNSSGVRMALVSLCFICVIVVMPYVYSLSRYVWFFLESSVRLV